MISTHTRNSFKCFFKEKFCCKVFPRGYNHNYSLQNSEVIEEIYIRRAENKND